MTPAAALRRSEDEVLLDRAGRVRLRLDRDDKPVGVTLDGAAGTLAEADGATGESSRDGVDVVVAPIDLKMRAAIALCRASGNPIVLVDQLGRMAGLCGNDEIYRALLQQRRAAEGA
jgi:glycine betaine/proline transport system ATP-binding protein